MPQLKVKLRFDYIGRPKAGKLFGTKNVEQLADNARQQKVSTMRNVPMQGIRIDDIDMSQDIYTLLDDITGSKVGYAPVVITLYAENIEDVVKFIVKEEFRTIEIIEPEELLFSKGDVEKLLFRFSQDLTDYREHWIRHMDNWR